MGVGEEEGWRFLFDLARENTNKETNKINLSAWVKDNEYWRQVEEQGIYVTVSYMQIAIYAVEKNMKLLMRIQGLGTVQENVRAN